MLEKVVALVKEVGQEVIMPRYLKVHRQYKSDGSFFTEADVTAQNVLFDGLREIDAVPLLGEEMSREEQEIQWINGIEGLWSVDPIDGTSNFFNGLPYFSISVAYLVQGKSVLGVVYNPSTHEMFYAQKGGGGFLNGVRLPLNTYVPDLEGAMANVDLKRLDRKLAATVAAYPPYASQRNYGASTLEWCYIAAGYFDLYLHGGQKPWDYAAGSLILSEAGGNMSGFDHDDYWAGTPWRRSVIAALDAKLFTQWRDWVRANR